MNTFEKYLVELLQNNIVYENKIIPVVRNFSQKPSLPVITLDLVSDRTVQKNRLILDSEQIMYTRNAQININLWCNTEDEREIISEQILSCFYDEISANYKYCTKINKETLQCEYLQTLCETITNPTNSRAIKGKCPNPDTYGYENLSSKLGLVWGSMNIEPPYILDEVDKTPPLLRNIFSAECQYEEYIDRGGAVIDEVEIGSIDVTKFEI